MGVVVVGAIVVVVGGGTLTGMSNLEDPTSKKLFHLLLLFIMLLLLFIMLLLFIVWVLKLVCVFWKFPLFAEGSTPRPHAAWLDSVGTTGPKFDEEPNCIILD